MKVQKSKAISAFGGINFVFDFFNKNKINSLIENTLPRLANQSQYSWIDVINTLTSIYLCGGDCIEDIHTHLKDHFADNPFVRMPSPDTVLRRISQLAVNDCHCKTKRGALIHAYNHNTSVNQLNLSLLKQHGVLDADVLTMDYDNTIIFNEKSDSKMTYKRNPGYQPAVCTINEEYVLYVEGRNGNSDAKSFQEDTLIRVFNMLENNKVKKISHFRADAASYQYEVVKLLEQKVKNFYIGCRNSYVEKYFTQPESWEDVKDKHGDIVLQVGEVKINPFGRQASKIREEPQEYRLIIKRKLKKVRQVDLLTGDEYEYRAILTNNNQLSAVEIAHFYNHRGNMEKQFDIMKNDFGWDNMPFSNMGDNTVFLYMMAMVKNLYNNIINYFSNVAEGLRPQYRIKKFLFRFIILPAKWVRRSRQVILRIYGKHNYVN